MPTTVVEMMREVVQMTCLFRSLLSASGILFLRNQRLTVSKALFVDIVNKFVKENLEESQWKFADTKIVEN